MTKRWETLKNNIKRARENNEDISLPLNDFYHKIETAQRLITFSEENIPKQGEIFDAYKYLIIMSVSAMESYFGGTAQLFIDSGKYKDTFFEVLKNEKVSLANLVEIKKEQMSLGEIISVSRAFQSLGEINVFFSKMFGVSNDKFIEEVSKTKVSEAEKQPLVLKERFPEFRKTIDQLISLRHQIIHQKFVWKLVPKSQLMEMIETLTYFVLSTEYYVMAKW